MTAEPTTERAGALRQTVMRHPLRVDTDGDFALDDLLALPGNGPVLKLNAAQTTLATLWRLDTAHTAELVTPSQPCAVAELDRPTEDDATCLHRIETGGLFRPPVHERVAALTPQLGAAWLALAARWIDLSRTCGDLRFLNAACKLASAVWLHHRSGSATQPSGVWQEPGLTSQLGVLASPAGRGDRAAPTTPGRSHTPSRAGDVRRRATPPNPPRQSEQGTDRRASRLWVTQRRTSGHRSDRCRCTNRSRVLVHTLAHRNRGPVRTTPARGIRRPHLISRQRPPCRTASRSPRPHRGTR
jgi:hypothetical protein